jgi:hypothetical protein
MERITTEWLTAEMIAKYRLALPYVNLTALCRKHEIPRQYVNRVLDGTVKKAVVVAKAALVLSEALSEYETACGIVENITKKKTA